MMLLIILTFLHLINDVHLQYLPQARLFVSPEVITEKESVQLHCAAQQYVKVSQCYFYPEEDKTNLKLSPSCRLSVTGSELIMWTRRKSPGTFHIICYYTVDKSVRTPSPHSLAAPVTVQNLPQPRLHVSPEVITQRGSVQLHCAAPHNVKVYQCYFYPEKNKANLKLSPSCRLSVTGSELIMWTRRRSPGTVHIICYYTVDKSGISSPSPHSLPAPVTVQNEKAILNIGFTTPPPSINKETSGAVTTETPTAVTTETPTAASSSISNRPSTTQDTTTKSLLIILSVFGVCVLLAGLMTVCLCMCIRKQMTERRKRKATHCDHGVMMPMTDMNNSNSEADGLYSEINHTPIQPMPLDPSGDVDVDSQKTEDDDYHTYCTVADTQVTTIDNDAENILLQIH